MADWTDNKGRTHNHRASYGKTERLRCPVCQGIEAASAAGRAAAQAAREPAKSARALSIEAAMGAAGIGATVHDGSSGEGWSQVVVTAESGLCHIGDHVSIPDAVEMMAAAIMAAKLRAAAHESGAYGWHAED